MIRTKFSRKVFVSVNSALMIIIAAVIAVPLWMVVLTSLSPDRVAAEQGFVLIPQGINFASYIRILKSNYMRAFYNSIFVTTAATAVSLLLTTMMAYGLAQKQLVFRKFIMNTVLLTMIISVGFIPHYLVVKNLGMIDSYTAIIIPAAISSYNLILMRNFFQALPESLIESGRLDGCSELAILFRIVLPISLPILAAVTLFYCVSHWNRYFDIILFINNSRKYTIQVLLRQLIFQESSDAGVAVQYNNFKMAVMMMAMLPVLILYPFIQKHFISGIMLGSVKE
jgi:putative aldouronate transport system permease protein